MAVTRHRAEPASVSPPAPQAPGEYSEAGDVRVAAETAIEAPNGPVHAVLTVANRFRALGDAVLREPHVFGVAVAGLAHAASIAAIVYFSLNAQAPSVSDKEPLSVPVDLVTVSDKTNIATTIETMEPRQAEAPAAPPPSASTPVPDFVENAAPKPLLMLSDMPKPATPSDTNPPTDGSRLPAAAPRNAHPADRAIKGGNAMKAATVDAVDALLAQIKPCWRPESSPHPEDLAVDFDLVLNADGSVARPPQLTADWANRLGDPSVRAAAEAARRAIYTCAPYRLPAERYARWHEINPLRFDPRQVGQ